MNERRVDAEPIGVDQSVFEFIADDWKTLTVAITIVLILISAIVILVKQGSYNPDIRDILEPLGYTNIDVRGTDHINCPQHFWSSTHVLAKLEGSESLLESITVCEYIFGDSVIIREF